MVRAHVWGCLCTCVKVPMLFCGEMNGLKTREYDRKSFWKEVSFTLRQREERCETCRWRRGGRIPGRGKCIYCTVRCGNHNTGDSV